MSARMELSLSQVFPLRPAAHRPDEITNIFSFPLFLALTPTQFLSRNTAVDMSMSIKALYTETRAFLEGKLVSAYMERS